jgi:hypothetical protein
MDKLIDLERQSRLESDQISNTKVINDIIDCLVAENDIMHMKHIVHALSKKKGFIKESIRFMMERLLHESQGSETHKKDILEIILENSEGKVRTLMTLDFL